MTNNLICIAKITKPHGIIGQAKLISYADPPENIFNYPCLYDENLNEYKLKMNAKTGSMFIVTFNKNSSRNLVEEIAGTNLYITREMLPKTEDNEYYNRDLEGLEVLNTDKKLCGHILEIRNFGADDIIEMSLIDKKDTIFLPFDWTFIIEINLDKKYMIYDFVNAGI